MKKYDVFISYSSHDQKVVEGLCAYLEQHKIRCFVAYRDIPRGVVWARAIVEALDESSMMVVVFSDHFNNSDQVDREIELASEDRKPILTFRITDDAFKGAKKYYLKNVNWIDAFPKPNEVFGSVVDSVVKLLKLEDSSSAYTSAELINNGETQESAERKAREAREEAKRKAREEAKRKATKRAERRQSFKRKVVEGLIASWRWLKWPSVILAAAFVLMVAGVYIDQQIEEIQRIDLEAERRMHEEYEAERRAREEAEQRMLAEGKGRNGVYQVGDYYNRDGKQGVVFEVWDNGRHGKIISLDQTKTQWDLRNEKVRDRTYADSKSDGKANTDTIMSRSDSKNFDAFEWCRAKGEEWYLPSKDELRVVYDNKSKINATLTKLKRVELDDWYWSSTEYKGFWARRVDMSEGYADYGNKSNYYYVRAVSAF